MADDPHVVVNDILSFLSCNYKKTPTNQIVRILGDFYSTVDIKDAHKILLEALVVQKSTRHARRVKNPDPAVAICECFQLIKTDDLPMFLCRDLNNVPQLSENALAPNVQVKAELPDEDDLMDEDEFLDMEEEFDPLRLETENESTQLEEFKRNQQSIKDQLSGIANIVKELKNNMKELTSKPPCLAGKRKRLCPSQKKIKIDLPQKSTSKSSSPRKSLAYLQKLIDEEIVKTNEKSDEEDYTADEEEAEDEFKDDFFDSDTDASYVEDATMQEASGFSGFGNSEQVVIYDNSMNGDSRYEGESIRMTEKVIHIGQSDVSRHELKSAERSIEISDVPGNFVELQTVSEGPNEIILEPRGSGSYLINDNLLPPVPQNPKKEQGFTCPLCGALFQAEINLVQHLVTHRSGQPLTCSICSFSCMNSRVMKKHLTDNHADKVVGAKKKLIYKCTFCGFECHSKQLIQAHIEHHYEEKGPNLFQCQVCQEEFSSRQLISKHKKTAHASACPFVCDICGHRFALKVYLKTHKKTHGGDKPYTCVHCGHKFANRSKLVLHERTHTGEKPFQCSYCDYRSSRTDNLKYHINSKHIGHAIRKCSRCDNKFAKEDMEAHSALHSKEMPYECLDCSRLFKSLGGLRVHYKSSQVHHKAHAAAMQATSEEKENVV